MGTLIENQYGMYNNKYYISLYNLIFPRLISIAYYIAYLQDWMF